MQASFLIASDLHGDADCTRLLLDRLEEENPTKLVLLGDLLYHGPRNDLPAGYRPKEVISLLNSVSDRILCVRGNCDTEVDQMVLNFPILADYAVLLCGDRLAYLTHGHRWNAENPPNLAPGELLLMGHTHVPLAEPFGTRNLCINPGSVSIPKAGSGKSYLVYRDGVFIWKSLETGQSYQTLSVTS